MVEKRANGIRSDFSGTRLALLDEMERLFASTPSKLYRCHTGVTPAIAIEPCGVSKSHPGMLVADPLLG